MAETDCRDAKEIREQLGWEPFTAKRLRLA